jgi:hypothetical protein
MPEVDIDPGPRLYRTLCLFQISSPPLALFNAHITSYIKKERMREEGAVSFLLSFVRVSRETFLNILQSLSLLIFFLFV